MKTIKKWAALALCLALFCSLLPQVSLTAHAETLSGSYGEDVTWTFDSDTGVLTFEGTGRIGSLLDTDEDLPILDFDPTEAVKTIEIKEGITEIGHSAFYCFTGLTSVSLPESLTSIDSCAFWFCASLTDITIPENVTCIEQSAFRCCDSLTAFEVASGNPSYSSLDGVLYNKQQSELIQYPAAKADIAFVIPDGVTCVDSYAFEDAASLVSVTIPDSVTEIYENTFAGCIALEHVTIPESVSSVGYGAFYGCSALTSVTLPSGLTAIYDRTFGECTALTAITIPEGVMAIGYGAFESCTALTDVTLPNSLTYIDSWAFCGCSSLTEVTIPESVEEIGLYAFGYHWEEDLGTPVAMDDFTIHGWYFSAAEDYANRNGFTFVPVPGSTLFSGICGAQGNNLTWKLDEETGVLTIEGSGEMGRTPWTRYAERITAVSFPEGLETISDDAFFGCTALTEVVLPKSLTMLGWESFSGCTALTSVTLSENLDSTGYFTFAGCTALRDVIFPKNLKEIGSGSFCSCSSLTKLSLPDGLMVIDEYAFSDCSALTDVSIPDSVQLIESGAFDSCTALTSVALPKDLFHLGDGALSNCSALASIEISSENQCYSSLDGVLYSKDQTGLMQYPAGKADAAFTVPGTVTTINKMAFAGCQALEQVSIPGSVARIGYRAFEGCKALHSLELAEGLQTIDNYAFFDCGLHDVTIPDSVKHIGRDALGFIVSNGGYIDLVQDFTIRGGLGTEAHLYAEQYAINFVSTDEKAPFEDISESDYFFLPVCWAFRNEITAGVDATHFGVNAACTREQMMTFLWKYAGSPEPEATESGFSDVAADEYYSQAVIWAEEMQITAGMGDGTFGVGRACTRAEAVTFLWALAGWYHWSEESFDDVKPDDWCYNAVEWAAENGITAGVGDRLFGAEQTCTRAQIVTFLFKLMTIN